jgi:hypothetical protein
MALARPIHSLPGDCRGGIEAAAGRAPIISKHRPSSNLSTFSDNAGPRVQISYHKSCGQALVSNSVYP